VKARLSTILRPESQSLKRSKGRPSRKTTHGRGKVDRKGQPLNEDSSEYETDFSIDSRTGEARLDRKGNPVKKHVIDPRTGDKKIGKDGKPIVSRSKREPSESEFEY